MLIDKNPSIISAQREFFGEEENIKILKGDFTDVSCGAIVSPANSFGFMDGGVECEISMRLGWELQFKLQEKLIIALLQKSEGMKDVYLNIAPLWAFGLNY